MNIYITEDERKFLLTNFEQMKSVLNCTNKQFDSNAEFSPLPLSSRLLAPATRTIAKFTNEKTSKKSVQKIVDVYNSLFIPSTDIDSFLSSDIFERDKPQLKQINYTNALVGDYFVFYLSDNFEKEIHGGWLKIYTADAQLSAHLIMGLFEARHFNEIETEVFGKLADIKNVSKMRSLFNSYRDRKPDVREYQNFSISTGSVTVLDRSAIISVRNMNNPNHVTVASIGISQNSNMRQFPGGMAVYLSPATLDLHTRICKMMVVRSADVLDILFEQLFNHHEQDDFWISQLQIEPNRYGRIEIQDEDITRGILNEISKLNRFVKN